MFGSVSSHFNPAVTLSEAVARRLPWRDAGAYVLVQCCGAILGVWLAHAMFDKPILMWSQHVRSGWSQALSETVATFGLLCTIFGTARRRPDAVPFAVAAFIVAAYWFTASTSFANPAVTIARSLTDTFAGIRRIDVPVFIGAQIVGALSATLFMRWLLSSDAPETVARRTAESPAPPALARQGDR